MEENKEAKISAIEEDVELDKSEKENREYKPRSLSNFPETKFYLPTLRQGYTRVIPI